MNAALAAQIAENVTRVQQQIAAAARAADRDPSEIRLVAAVKYATDEQVEALLACGCCDLAESRPQNLWRRAELFAGRGIRWHFIGHMQRNKIRRTLPHIWCLHSADSWRVLEALDAEASRLAEQDGTADKLRLLIEVNISGDENKGGFAPQDLPDLVPRLAEFSHLHVVGLMGMASLYGGREVARQNFLDLRALRDRLAPLCPAGVSLTELSMGMSGDFDLAIAAGATMVRIGSALFEGLEPADEGDEPA